MTDHYPLSTIHDPLLPDSPHDECGIIGVYAPNEDVASMTFYGLYALQHRGQEAAGIAVSDGEGVRLHKDVGLVSQVFNAQNLAPLRGHYAIGHTRYSTTGSPTARNAQPFLIETQYGPLGVAHNGNLINTDALRRDLYAQDRRHINTGSDSEVLLNIFAHELAAGDAVRPQVDDVFAAIARVHERCAGGYAVVSLLLGLGVVAFRDVHGIRPLVLGKRDTPDGSEWAIASESVALDLLGFKRERDVRPGECIIITAAGEMHTRACAAQKQLAPCIFEYVYFARPDSMIVDVSGYKAL